MKERPILFSAPMVRAILEGRKTQTRRVVKPQPVKKSESEYEHGDVMFLGGQLNRLENPRGRNKAASGQLNAREFVCPYGMPGDWLWVREGIHCDIDDGWVYDADGGTLKWRPEDEDAGIEWLETRPAKRSSYPSIHVPRMFSRITLEVVKVRVERLRDISEADAIAEGPERNIVEGLEATWTPDMGYRTRCAHYPDGCECFPHVTARDWFLDLFFNINNRAEPDSNPWVWVVEFRRVPLPRAAEAQVQA